MLWKALLVRDAVKTEAEIELAARRMIRKMKEVNLIKAGMIAANKACRIAGKGASEEEALSLFIEHTSLPQPVSVLICRAAFQCPNDVTRYDYACLHRVPDAPWRQTDEHYLVGMLVKGLLQCQSEQQDVEAYKQSLVQKGVPAGGIDAIRVALRHLFEVAERTESKSAVFETLKRMKIDRPTAEAIYASVNGFGQGLDLFINVVEGNDRGITQIEFEREMSKLQQRYERSSPN